MSMAEDEYENDACIGKDHLPNSDNNDDDIVSKMMIPCNNLFLNVALK